MNVASRTLAAPLKERRFYRTPSQSIGNNYSPQVQHLRVKGLYQQLKALRTSAGLLASCCLNSSALTCCNKQSKYMQTLRTEIEVHLLFSALMLLVERQKGHSAC